MLNKFKYEAERVVRGSKHKLWQDGYHAIELVSNQMTAQKLEYIHNNPVEEGIVFEPEHYEYSSAIDYSEGKSLLEITFLE